MATVEKPKAAVHWEHCHEICTCGAKSAKVNGKEFWSIQRTKGGYFYLYDSHSGLMDDGPPLGHFPSIEDMDDAVRDDADIF